MASAGLAAWLKAFLTRGWLNHRGAAPANGEDIEDDGFRFKP